MPLANFLKFYFKKHPVLGSRDRKIISEMAYCFYRCAKGFEPATLDSTERVNAALLLAESNVGAITRVLPEHLRPYYGQSFAENASMLQEQGIRFIPDQLLLQKFAFSEGVERADWLGSMLLRPRLFIRVGRKYKTTVLQLLTDAAIMFEEMAAFCFALPNGTAVEKIIPQKMYRIQDASSQQTAAYFTIKGKESCWDCCSGAGGKSLLVKDIAPESKLCVSDVRASILDNLAERFRQYDSPVPERLLVSVADAVQTKSVLGNRLFDHIIADVPCSGSGTWARTPEQLYFFDPASLAMFTEKQTNIASNALAYLKPGGTFIYITCSVFAAENEVVTRQILALHPSVTLERKALINGIALGADCMFIAVFKKN